MPKIKVHEKALAHLSRGLYRSPASAIRELVSNAWDANAKTVSINTNFPLFLRLSVSDDGDGFSKQHFAEMMAGGIGNSMKRLEAEQLKYERPLIGRLGIGMLGIAQICGSFTVTSIPKRGEPFRAQVRLYDQLREQIDEKGSGLVSDATLNDLPLKTVDVGDYEFETDFDPAAHSAGTTVSSDDLNPIFVRSFKKTLEGTPNRPLDWAGALKIISRKNSLQELGDYWRLLWELAAACPIPYLNERAVPKGLIKADQERLESYRFSVVVDGLQLRKPILLRGNKGGYTTRMIALTTVRIYGKTLSYHGYIVVQEGVQLKPDELRGIMIRIKNVAIGYYDQSMLDYRFNQGPRSRWVNGEIYVDEGLEDALNIDRDSFNRFHPEFKCIQEHVHLILKDEIFPAVYRNIDARSHEKVESRLKEKQQDLEELLSDFLGKRVNVGFMPESGTAESPADVSVDEGPNRVRLRIPNPKAIKIKKSNRQLASAVLAIFELTRRNPDRSNAFADLLLKLLDKW